MFVLLKYVFYSFGTAYLSSKLDQSENCKRVHDVKANVCIHLSVIILGYLIFNSADFCCILIPSILKLTPFNTHHHHHHHHSFTPSKLDFFCLLIVSLNHFYRYYCLEDSISKELSLDEKNSESEHKYCGETPVEIKKALAIKDGSTFLVAVGMFLSALILYPQKLKISSNFRVVSVLIFILLILIPKSLNLMYNSSFKKKGSLKFQTDLKVYAFLNFLLMGVITYNLNVNSKSLIRNLLNRNICFESLIFRLTYYNQFEECLELIGALGRYTKEFFNSRDLVGQKRFFVFYKYFYNILELYIKKPLPIIVDCITHILEHLISILSCLALLPWIIYNYFKYIHSTWSWSEKHTHAHL